MEKGIFKTMERIEKITNGELKELLMELKTVEHKRKDVIDKAVKLDAEIKLVDQEHGGLLTDRQKLIDKMKPIVDKEFEGKLGEFEIVANLDLEDEAKDEVTVKIIDEVEFYKEEKRKLKNKVEEKVAETTE